MQIGARTVRPAVRLEVPPADGRTVRQEVPAEAGPVMEVGEAPVATPAMVLPVTTASGCWVASPTELQRVDPIAARGTARVVPAVVTIRRAVPVADTPATTSVAQVVPAAVPAAVTTPRVVATVPRVEASATALLFRTQRPPIVQPWTSAVWARTMPR